MHRKDIKRKVLIYLSINKIYPKKGYIYFGGDSGTASEPFWLISMIYYTFNNIKSKQNIVMVF